MQIGVFMPISTKFGVPADPSFAFIKEFALRAEALGLDSLWFGDHFIIPPDEHGGQSAWWEMWSMITALAAVTNRVTLGAFVSCSLFRNPGVTAKQAEALDEISGGRFVLGLGAGWNELDFSMFGLPFDRRVSRFEEALTITSSLVRTGYADFQGAFYQANAALNLPRGPRAATGGSPILIGGHGPRMLGLVARYADIWDSDFLAGAEALKPMLADVDRACEAADRDPATLLRSTAIHCAFDGAYEPWGISIRGGASTIARELTAFRELGVRQVVVAVDPATPRTLEQIAGAIELIG
ncbi:MAG: LLM class flavin-dependent oxidoreductase [Thermomicrobiales bacterium]|nr:LLM class flavin-dependent oxidoreductase [Thermomicrobiales bacterium]